MFWESRKVQVSQISARALAGSPCVPPDGWGTRARFTRSRLIPNTSSTSRTARKRENLPNIRTILGKEDDPLLSANSVNAVLLLKTYHEIGQPVRLLTRVRQAMRAGALFGIIDREGDADSHGIDKATVIEEAGRAGFALAGEHDFVKPDNVDYFLVFRAK